MEDREQQIVTQLVYMTDFLFETLRASEQAIVLQVFSRTLAVGEDSCRLSLKDFEDLTGMAESTVRRSVATLKKRGILQVLDEHTAKLAKSYRLLIPTNYPQKHRIQRNPHLLFRKEGAPAAGPRYTLTDNGKVVLETIRESLGESELADIHRLAKMEMVSGEKLEDKVDEIIIRRYFSEEKKRKYLIFKESEP